MSDTNERPLDAQALRRLAGEVDPASRLACACSVLHCPGWESLPSSFAPALLRRVGTLASAPRDAEPPLDEYHPDGTSYWSADAPVAIDHFPYNCCDVWLCRQCRRSFLRYTEYGGYYVDHRIRELDPALIVDAAPKPGW